MNGIKNTEKPVVGHCLRCGRALRNASIDGYGPKCRAMVRKAARAQVIAQYKAHQVAKAEELIEQGGLIPLRGRHVFLAASSDGSTTTAHTAPPAHAPPGSRASTPASTESPLTSWRWPPDHPARRHPNRNGAHMTTAILITPEAGVVPIELPDTADEHGTVYRAVLRCRYFDVVALTSRLDMWIDDEGLYTHPVNPIATALAQRHGFIWQPYHGPVLLTGGADADGNTLPLTEDQARALLASVEDTLTD